MKTQLVWLAALALVVGCKSKSEHTEEKDEHREHEGEHGEKEGEHAEGERVVSLTAEAARAAELQVAPVTRKALAHSLSVPARLSLTQEGMVKIGARVPGRVTQLRVKPGDRVAAGRVLAQLDSPELGQARAEYLGAAVKVRVAGTVYQREQELVDKGISSERELREAEAGQAVARSELDAADAKLHSLGLSEQDLKELKSADHEGSGFPLRSPIDGTVIEVRVSTGESVEGTTHLFTVGNLTVLWALLDIAESDLSKVRAGQPVTLTLQAVPGRQFAGRVDYVGDFIDEKTRTVQVRVIVPNRERLLKPGMFATAEIGTTGGAPDGGGPEGLVVPREAVQKVGDEQVVFVEDGPNKFRAVDVTVGRTTASEAEIVSGLKGDEKIVTSGAFILRSELSKKGMGEGHAH